MAEQSFRVQSLDTFRLDAERLVYVVESPVEAPRAEILAALGPHLEIDGAVVKPFGVEANCLAGPIQRGERIGIVVNDGAARDQASVADSILRDLATKRTYPEVTARIDAGALASEITRSCDELLAALAQMRCRTCKHWQDLGRIYGTGESRKRGACALAEFSDSADQLESGLATARAGDGYEGILETLPEHGCTMWEQRT